MMLDSLLARLRRTSPWTAAALMLLFVLCGQAFETRKTTLGFPSLDSRFTYSAADAQSLMNDLGPAGRRHYATSELTLDLLFPLTYGFLFALLLAHLYPPPAARYLVLVPLADAVFDLLENVSIATLALTFDGQPSALAGLAQVFTRVKIVLFVASIVLIVVGTARALIRGE
jgi:hypothetical protein